MIQIDAIDEQILTELQANGRLTMKALAERIGLSSPAMIERVRRLEERGVIAGYRAVIAPGALGRPLSAIILADVAPADSAAFLKAAEEEAGVVECHRITGAANFLLKAHVGGTVELQSLLDALGETGARCNASVVLSSPVEWREVPSSGEEGGTQRARRRRRAEGEVENSDVPLTPRRPGRPRRNPAALAR
jgi:Lrp/AsnC family transcriptional regulator, leucine-responsive regulatory protein